MIQGRGGIRAHIRGPDPVPNGLTRLSLLLSLPWPLLPAAQECYSLHFNSEGTEVLSLSTLRP